MRFLLDKNISFRLGFVLQAHGHDVIHADDLSMGDADDLAILHELGRLLLANRDAVAEHLHAGAVVAVGRHDVRVRRLPLR